MKSLLPLGLVLLSLNSHAATLQGVEMPDTQNVAGKTLILNGQGLREATIFNVKVYVAGLYLQNASSHPEEILKSPELKKVDMHFIHDVDVDKIRETWEESFKKNCAPDCDALRPAFSKMLALMKDMKKGDTMSFTFLPGRLELSVKKAPAVALESASLGRMVLATWLGKDPPNKSLKEGLLGKTKK